MHTPIRGNYRLFGLDFIVRIRCSRPVALHRDGISLWRHYSELGVGGVVKATSVFWTGNGWDLVDLSILRSGDILLAAHEEEIIRFGNTMSRYKRGGLARQSVRNNLALHRLTLFQVRMGKLGLTHDDYRGHVRRVSIEGPSREVSISYRRPR